MPRSRPPGASPLWTWPRASPCTPSCSSATAGPSSSCARAPRHWSVSVATLLVGGAARAVPGPRLVGRLATAQPQQLVDVGRAAVGSRGGDELDRVQRAGADLDLLGRSVLDQVTALDALRQCCVEAQDPVEAQDVGDEVVGE